ncbi:hypothetical protein K0M31_007186 [Melipona bicolor]|uniref:Uncharacterized protein n=1 Tax=Melipona bicolor TaxID=60889 RepID=A0AA40FSF7_9HYME|nr:hypothetical protein K0M31_007186 [Melipona bicolor]
MLESSGLLQRLQKDEEKKTAAAPWTVSRMSGWQFRGADPVSHGVRLIRYAVLRLKYSDRSLDTDKDSIVFQSHNNE